MKQYNPCSESVQGVCPAVHFGLLSWLNGPVNGPGRDDIVWLKLDKSRPVCILGLGTTQRYFLKRSKIFKNDQSQWMFS